MEQLLELCGIAYAKDDFSWGPRSGSPYRRDKKLFIIRIPFLLDAAGL